jgi:flagellar assembly protein FliH
MIIKKRSEIKEKQEPKVQKEQVQSEKKQDEEIDLFDLDNIDFSQRQERRRGDRRRGYRRIDDRNLISRAQEEAGTIRENAAKEGYKAGLEKAQEDVQQVRVAIEEFLGAKKDVFEYIAPDILEISVEIARKIVKKEIEQDPTIVLQSIVDVLKSMSKDETKVTVKVNPSQAALVKENLPEIISASGVEARVNVSVDDTIEVGSCIVHTNNGVVDASIDTQLEIIAEAFKGM